MKGVNGIFGTTLEIASLKDPDKRVKAVAREFESLFLHELLKEMDKTLEKGLFGGGFSGSIYQSLFELQLAEHLAEQGTGLSKMIEKALKK